MQHATSQHIYLKSRIHKPWAVGEIVCECVREIEGWMCLIKWSQGGRDTWLVAQYLIFHAVLWSYHKKENAVLNYPWVGESPSTIEGHCWKLRSLAGWGISRNSKMLAELFLSGKGSACNLLWGLCDTPYKIWDHPEQGWGHGERVLGLHWEKSTVIDLTQTNGSPEM